MIRNTLHPKQSRPWRKEELVIIANEMGFDSSKIMARPREPKGEGLSVDAEPQRKNILCSPLLGCLGLVFWVRARGYLDVSPSGALVAGMLNSDSACFSGPGRY